MNITDIEDIKAVGRARFERQHGRKCWIIILICWAATIGLLGSSQTLGGIYSWSFLLPLIAAIIYSVSYSKKRTQAVETLVSQSEKDST